MLKELMRDWRGFFDYQHTPVQTDLAVYQNLLEKINSIHLENESDLQLKQLGAELKIKANQGIVFEDIIIPAYALVREVAWRVLDQRPYDTQILAGLAMHDGKVIDMLTGEGKTLAAVFPAYLNALTGKGAHILTFNDYLAKRDATWMRPIFNFLDLTVGYITNSMDTLARKAAYACDITYITAKEAGFDYLRSFLCHQPLDIPQRPFNFAIIDEVDSILIDEGRIPLVIADKQPLQDIKLEKFADIVGRLVPEVDYRFDNEHRNVYLTETGISKVENELNIDNLYKGQNCSFLMPLNNALHAEILLKRDIDYIVQNGKIELVDEFTGRIVENRHWPNGLQEALEAKEGLKRQQSGKILGTITMQHFINAYPKIAGMTGTAQTAADELKEFYNLEVVVIPPHQSCIRIDESDLVFTTYQAKTEGLIKEISRVHETGRPILVGTSSIQESEYLGNFLRQTGIPVRVLNAKHDEIEAEIIAEAGAIGAVTISTNMAGRGTDIRLGGKNEQDHAKVVALGGLYVIGLNRFESVRIDNQLRGRSGRQGDPGSSRFFVSLQDELLVRYGMTELISIKNKDIQDNGLIRDPEIYRQIAHIQKVIEAQNFEIRKNLWKYSWIVEQKRREFHLWRQDILFEKEIPNLFESSLSERYSQLRRTVEPEILHKAEKEVLLYHIDQVWADFLEQVSEFREGIHLVQLSKRDPLVEFHRLVQHTARDLRKLIEAKSVDTLKKIEITSNGFDIEKEGIKSPSAIWTYLINDTPFEMNLRTVMGFIAEKIRRKKNGVECGD